MLTTPCASRGTITPSRVLADADLARIATEEFLVDAPHALGCMDGRSRVDGYLPGVNLPGGSILLVAATMHLLSRAASCEHSDSAIVIPSWEEVIATIIECSHTSGFPVGVHRGSSHAGHRDDHDEIAPSGCAAADGLNMIAEVSASECCAVRALGNVVGIETLCDHLRFATPPAPGSEIIRAFAERDEPVAHLMGEHHENLIILNRRAGTTINRTHIAEEFNGCEVFSIDLWVLPRAVKVIERALHRLAPHFAWESAQWCSSRSTREDAMAAMATLSFAALLVLCPPGMPILTID